MKGTILVVDDEPSIVELVAFNLERAGYAVSKAYDGLEALEKARQLKPALLVLDVMLPSVDGFDVCRELRKESQVPILFLTAREDEVDRVLGLELGADDYLTKPFSPRELVARVKAILRRTAARPEEGEPVGKIEAGDLVIDVLRHEVTLRGAKVNLTPREFQLLRFLAADRGRAFAREQLLEALWGHDFYGDSRIVDVHISHLRDKIEDDPLQPLYIVTVRGVGYKFRD